ncbi:MAG TPA: hypothetical protein VFY82_06585 [Acidimicrobiales bacterium]|nr:hypothetical protein [Acidimicrobiales bacterium]
MTKGQLGIQNGLGWGFATSVFWKPTGTRRRTRLFGYFRPPLASVCSTCLAILIEPLDPAARKTLT